MHIRRLLSNLLMWSFIAGFLPGAGWISIEKRGEISVGEAEFHYVLQLDSVLKLACWGPQAQLVLLPSATLKAGDILLPISTEKSRARLNRKLRQSKTALRETQKSTKGGADPLVLKKIKRLRHRVQQLRGVQAIFRAALAACREFGQDFLEHPDLTPAPTPTMLPIQTPPASPTSSPEAPPTATSGSSATSAPPTLSTETSTPTPASIETSTPTPTQTGTPTPSATPTATAWVCRTWDYHDDPPGHIALGDINEASGIAASRQHPGVLWTHNDSGDGNFIYAISTAGALLGKFTVTGSLAHTDSEDIAIGPGAPGESQTLDHIYWGDIGDNNGVRSYIYVKRILEPQVIVGHPTHELSADTIRLQYPGGEHAPAHKDAETLMVDPLSGDIYIVTKRGVPNKVYRAAYPHNTTDITTLEWVTDLPSEFDGNGDWSQGPTGGDISPDGRLIIIRQNIGDTPNAAIWYRMTTIQEAFATSYCPVPMLSSESGGTGEAVGWDPEGRGVYTVRDQMTQSPIDYMRWNP
jgi:hypothetical protein